MFKALRFLCGKVTHTIYNNHTTIHSSYTRTLHRVMSFSFFLVFTAVALNSWMVQPFLFAVVSSAIIGFFTVGSVVYFMMFVLEAYPLPGMYWAYFFFPCAITKRSKGEDSQGEMEYTDKSTGCLVVNGD